MVKTEAKVSFDIKFPKKLWQSSLLMLCAGALLSFAYAPYHQSWISFISFSLLAWGYIDLKFSDTPQNIYIFIRGWFFGLGFFSASLHWIYEAFLVDANQHAWMIPFALIFFCGGLALFWGIAFTLSTKLWRRVKWEWTGFGLMILAASFALLEFFRATLFTGFPWNPIGFSWGPGFLVMLGNTPRPITDFAAVLFFSWPVVMFFRSYSYRNRIMTLLMLISLSLIISHSIYVRKNPKIIADTQQKAVIVHMIQPAIPQVEKWQPELQKRNFDILLNETKTSLSKIDASHQDKPALVIWPEAAAPFDIFQSPIALEAIKQLLPENTILVAGFVHSKIDSKGEKQNYNSIFALDHEAEIIAQYDKTKLVPFGEFLPFEKDLNKLGLSPMAKGFSGFTAGKQHKRLTLPAPYPSIVPLICYETIFEGYGKQKGNSETQHPQLAVVVTNDGWFGTSIGPKQHLFASQVKSVELGMPMLRSAYTGISAAISKNGKVIADLPTNERGSMQLIFKNNQLFLLQE